MTRAHTGFAGVVQDRWPRPRGWTSPERVGTLPATTLPGVGQAFAKRLRVLGIDTVGDVLAHAPRRYESAADEVPIAKLGLAEGEVAIEGRIVSARSRPLRGRRTLVTAAVADGSGGGQISASFFNQPWLLEKLTPGTSIRLRGKLGRYGFDVKSYDLGEARRTADYAPVYPASEQVPSTRLRELVRACARGARRAFSELAARGARAPAARRRARARSISRRATIRRTSRDGASRSTSSSRCSSSSRVCARRTRSRRRSPSPAS